jgi:nitric oxide synthase oxygenase domain/subunit
VETIEHYFYECKTTLDFWLIFKTWWNSLNLIHKKDITEKEILLGSLLDNKLTKTFNCVLLIAKSSIYGNKSNNIQPDFFNFLVQLKYYLKIEKQINIKNNTETSFEISWGEIAINL